MDFIPPLEAMTDDKIMGASAVSLVSAEDDEGPSKEEAKMLRKRVYGLVRHHIWWLLCGLLGAAMVREMMA